MLGFKIFDNDGEDKLRTILDFADNEKLCIEIALYNDKEDTIAFTKFLLENANYKNIQNKSIHLDYKKYIGGDLNLDSIEKFKEEMSIAKKLNIQHAVLHYQTPSTYMNHLKQLESDNLRRNLQLINEISLKFGIIVYIENTYIYQRKDIANDLIHHRKIWDTIIDLNFQKNIGICLDWGHVKSFSNDDLEDWIDYVKYLRNNSMNVYMHVHDNDGKKDLHEPLHNGREKGFDKIPGNKPFLDMLSKYINEFQNESLILEYKSEWAIEEYLKIKNELSL